MSSSGTRLSPLFRYSSTDCLIKPVLFMQKAALPSVVHYRRKAMRWRERQVRLRGINNFMRVNLKAVGRGRRAGDGKPNIHHFRQFLRFRQLKLRNRNALTASPLFCYQSH